MANLDFEQNRVKDRYRKDPDTNDYNMIIMAQRAKLNEIAKIYRLSNRQLTTDTLRRELFYYDSFRSVVGFFKKRRKELLKLKVISEQTWKNYGSTIQALEEFNPMLRWDQVNVKFMYEFRAWLKKKTKRGGKTIGHNTVWTRLKDLKSFFRVANEEIQV